MSVYDEAVDQLVIQLYWFLGALFIRKEWEPNNSNDVLGVPWSDPYGR